MSGPSQQVEFFFSGPPVNTDPGAARTDYGGFNLNAVEYKLGDYAFLYPEEPEVPHYLGRIVGIFQDRSGAVADPHCVEVAWYERRAHLEPNTQGSNWEREVVALEETDVNPIGCISGKTVVFRAGGYEEARQMAQSVGVEDWLFCRGVYKPRENCILPFPELAGRPEAMEGKRHGKRGQAGVSGHTEGVADSDEVKRQRVAEEQPAPPVRRSGKLVSGRTCVECGATQTPQWREGPAGPKTLCNACGVRYVRAQQRANKRSVSAGASRGGFSAGGRQPKTYKQQAAKADAASARAARGAAFTAAAMAASTEETSQRPLRQAALMAASKTAQYARTGVFPVCASDLQQLLPPPPPGGSGALAAAARGHPTAAVQPQDSADADGMAAAYGAGPGATAAAAADGGAVFRPDTPNCSSFDSCGSLHGGVTVEVVVGPADGDVECCGAGSAGGYAGSAAAVTATAAIPVAYPLLAPSAAALLTQQTLCGVPVPTEQSDLGRMPVLGPLGSNHVWGSPAPPQLPTSAAAAGVELGAAAGLMANPGTDGLEGFIYVVDGRFGCGEQSCFTVDLCQQQLCRAVAAVDFGASEEPSRSSRGAAVGAGAAAHCGVCCAASSGAAVESCFRGGDGAAQQVVSAPVSPSARGSTGGGAGSDDGFGCCAIGSCGGAGGGGAGGVLDVDGDVHLRGYGSLGIGMGMSLDEEYSSLMEVDFGLGPASALGNSSLFDDDFNHHHGSVLGCEEDSSGDRPFPPQQQLQQQHQDQPTNGGDHRVEVGLSDLPAIAARAAAFSPADLAPGTDARRLLDALPALATPSDVGAMPVCQDFGCPLPAAPAANVVALPEEAVAHLVALGREANRAATEARVADAALEAVSQVLEVHQEAARRARDAAVTNLGRLNDCIKTSSRVVAAAAAAGGGNGDDGRPAAGGAGGGGGGRLIDMQALGGGVITGGGGGLRMGMVPVGAGGGCCSSFDGADPPVVAVHS